MPRIDRTVDDRPATARGASSCDASAAALRAIAAAARDPARAALCLDLVAGRQSALPSSPALAQAAAILVWATGDGANGEEGLVTPIQASRAIECLSRAPRVLQERFAALSVSAESDGERAVLLKALAARSERRADPAVGDELAAVADQVRGRPIEWLLEHTTVRETTSRKGLRQAWTTSCVPTVKLLAEAEHDPAVALRVTLDPRPMNAIDSFAATTQKETLLEFGGWPRARPADEPSLKQGAPRGPLATWMASLVDTVQRTVLPGEGTSMGDVVPALARALGGEVERIERAKFDDALVDRIVMQVRRGEDVPLRIEPVDDDGPGHAVIVVDCIVTGAARTLRVHDPATGRTASIDARELLAGTIFPTKSGALRHVTDVYFLNTGNGRA